MMILVKIMATYSGWIEKYFTSQKILFMRILIGVYIRDPPTPTTVIHYCTQSVWVISLSMKVAYSVFRSVISFRKFPWYFLVCYIQEIITTTRGLLKLSSLSAKRYTADYCLSSFYSQNCYSELSKLVLFLFLWGRTKKGTLCAIVHWPMRIILFLLCFLLNYHGTLFLSQISNLWFCGIF